MRGTAPSTGPTTSIVVECPRGFRELGSQGEVDESTRTVESRLSLKRPAHRQLNSSGQATKMWCLIGEKKPQAAASVELEGFTSSTAQPKKVIFFFQSAWKTLRVSKMTSLRL